MALVFQKSSSSKYILMSANGDINSRQSFVNRSLETLQKGTEWNKIQQFCLLNPLGKLPLHDPHYVPYEVVPRYDAQLANVGRVMISVTPPASDEIPSRIKDFLTPCDDGSFVPNMVSTRFLKDILEMKVRPSDVMVVTMPKSGTTWMQYIVTKLLCAEELTEENNLFQVNLFLEAPQDPTKIGQDDSVGFYKEAEERPSPRLLKSHLKLSMLPTSLLDSNAKIIYVVRNPKDAAVSFFNFCRMVPMLPNFEDWSEFFEYFYKGLLPYGDWFEHVLPWWEKRNEPNVLFIKYEDMKKNPKHAINLVSNFLGKSLSEEELEDIATQSSFEAMKKNPAANPDLFKSPIGKTSEIDFMRKGKVGDWKNYFTVLQNERFDNLYQEKMEGSGLQLDFE